MSKQSLLKRAALCGSAVVTLSFATGCANMSSTASSVTAAASAGTMKGTVHGGNQPVSGADVRLYAAGMTGYGSAPTLYASTTSASDGSFSFTKTAGAGTSTTPVYGCPTGTGAVDPQMYISARGGNTQGAGNGANSAAGFIAAIGKCSTISAATQVNLNEVVTVGTLAALQQYFNPPNANSGSVAQLGMPSSAQGQAGFANGVATIPNLVTLATGGIAANTVTGTPAGGAAITVTVTPEASKINTIANIASACVNTTSNSSSACTTLFANATPPSAAVTSQPTVTFNNATTTLGAIYNMLTNPTSGSSSNLTNLFNLQSAQAVFQPMESGAPTDWTVGLRYSSSSACASGAAFLLYPYHLATDATGNVWAVSNASGGNLFELSPAGAPLTCTLGASTGNGTGMTIDINGNVWTSGNAATATTIYEYNPTTGASTAWPTGLSVGVQAITSDRAGNIVFTTSSSTSLSMYEFVNGANATAATAPVQISGTLGSSPYFLAADTSNRFYATQSSTSPAAIYQVYPGTAGDATYLNGFDTSNIGSSSTTYNPYGIGAGLNSVIATVNGNTTNAVANALSLFTPAGGGTASSTFISAQYAGGIGGPRELAVDGAGNIWVANSQKPAGVYSNPAATTGQYEVAEFSATGTALSPTGSSTSLTTINGGFQKDTLVAPNAFRGIAIDPTGNVWIGSNASGGIGITEIVGAAVPVVTPIPAALLAGATTGNAVSKP